MIEWWILPLGVVLGCAICDMVTWLMDKCW